MSVSFVLFICLFHGGNTISILKATQWPNLFIRKTVFEEDPFALRLSFVRGSPAHSPGQPMAKHNLAPP